MPLRLLFCNVVLNARAVEIAGRLTRYSRVVQSGPHLRESLHDAIQLVTAA